MKVFRFKVTPRDRFYAYGRMGNVLLTDYEIEVPAIDGRQARKRLKVIYPGDVATYKLISQEGPP